MNKILSVIGKILAWVVLTLAFSAIGLGTDNPSVMVPAYAIAFVIILGAILFYVSKHKRHSFDDIKTPKIIPFIAGAILILVSLGFPAFSLAKFRPGLIPQFSVIIFTVILLGLGFIGVWLINCLSMKNKLFSIIGYLILVLAAAFPALAIAAMDTSYGTLGVMYFTAMLEAIIIWSGFSMFYKGLKSKN